MELEKNIFGKYKINKKNSDSYLFIGIASVSILITIWFLLTVQTDWSNIVSGRLSLILRGLLNWASVESHQWGEIVWNMISTLMIAILVTIISVVIAIQLSIFGAKNLYKGWPSSIIKFLSALIRSIPTIVWAILFISIYGLNVTTAIVAMFFHSLAFFIKSFSETIEEADEGIVEALKATGSSRLKIVVCAIYPQSIKKIIGWITLRLEINIAVVIIIAPAIGVPNSIGYLISTYYRNNMYGQLGVVFIIIVGSTLLLEWLSKKIVGSIGD